MSMFIGTVGFSSPSKVLEIAWCVTIKLPDLRKIGELSDAVGYPDVSLKQFSRLHDVQHSDIPIFYRSLIILQLILSSSL